MRRWNLRRHLCQQLRHVLRQQSRRRSACQLRWQGLLEMRSSHVHVEWRLRVVHHHVDILLLHGLLVMLQMTLLYLVWWDHPHLSLLLFLHLPLPLLLLAPLQLKSTEALLLLPVSTLLRHVHHTLFRV